MTSKPYPTDLTDEEWSLISSMFVTSEQRGVNRRYELRRILDGCFYVLRGGISWRMMPHDLPPWRVVYDHFSTWRRTGKWERINQVLRESYRAKRGRGPLPTAAVIDSQSVKTTASGGPRGYDGGKKIKSGRRSSIRREPFSRSRSIRRISTTRSVACSSCTAFICCFQPSSWSGQTPTTKA